MASDPRALVASIETEYRRYDGLARSSFEQLDDDELTACPDGANSVATLVWHVSGNLESRFTDFLTSDGEKPWRHRESEFERREVVRDALLERWERGMRVLFDTLATLTDDDLGREVSIRQVPLAVHQALHRSLAHLSYHVGQIVYLAKMLRGEAWRYLSIPPGGSERYNQDPTRERPPEPPAR